MCLYFAIGISLLPENGRSLFHQLSLCWYLHMEYLVESNQSSMFLAPVDLNEINNELGRLKSKKDCGLDEITNKIIKSCSQELITPLSKIMNLSLQTGVFPNDLKLACVIPIHKKRERFLPGNYRPISFLNSFSKIIKKIVHRRFTLFWNSMTFYTSTNLDSEKGIPLY